MLTDDDIRAKLKAQDAALEKAILTGIPVDDGYGTRWHPPDKAGNVIKTPTPKQA